MISAMKQDLRVRYDQNADVLYVSIRPGVPARSQADDRGVVWRYDADAGDLIGMTIIDYEGYWREHRRELVERIASRFSMKLRDARAVLASAERRM